MTFHQQKQIEIISSIEKQIANNTLQFSTVSPVENYEEDKRICLTSVHIPNETLKTQIEETIIQPLREIEPDYYYYSADSLHMTIKNVRVIHYPPNFSSEDMVRVGKVFSQVIPIHKKFSVYFYRLLLFQNNLALIGTTDEEFDNIFLDLDKELKEIAIPDDKTYANSQYFFSNITLARFLNASEKFKEKIKELSNSLIFKKYTVTSVTLLTCNAVFKKRHIIDTWGLQ